MEIVKTNPRTKKVVNYAAFSADSDSSDDEFVGVPKSVVIAPAAQRPTKFSKLKLGAKSAESGGGNTKLNLKTEDNFTRLKPTQPPPEIDLTIIPEPDLVIHSLSSQETELISSCECLSSQEFSVEASPQATTAQLNASSGSDSDIILPSRANIQERNKRRILDDDVSVERKKSRIEPAVEEVKVVAESLIESNKKNISSSRDHDKEIKPAETNLKSSCERYEIVCESNAVEKSNESQKLEEIAQPVEDPTCQLKEKERHTEERLPPPAELGGSPPNITKTNKKSEATKPVVVPQIASLVISSAKPDPQPLPSKKGRNALPSNKTNKPELKRGRKENNSAVPAPPPQIPKIPPPLPDVPKEAAVPSTTDVFTKPSVHPASTNLVKRPAASRIPAWNPPGKANGASSPVVGSSPVIGLRLGLSRNRRAIKPLHPDVKLK